MWAEAPLLRYLSRNEVSNRSRQWKPWCCCSLIGREMKHVAISHDKPRRDIKTSATQWNTWELYLLCSAGWLNYPHHSDFSLHFFPSLLSKESMEMRFNHLPRRLMMHQSVTEHHHHQLELIITWLPVFVSWKASLLCILLVLSVLCLDSQVRTTGLVLLSASPSRLWWPD